QRRAEHVRELALRDERSALAPHIGSDAEGSCEEDSQYDACGHGHGRYPTRASPCGALPCATQPSQGGRGERSLECFLVFDISGEIRIVCDLRRHAACLLVSKLALDEGLQDFRRNGHNPFTGALDALPL